MLEFGHGYGMFGGWFYMLLVWMVPILIIIAIIKFLTNSAQLSGKSKTPLVIIEEAYARGELSREDFLQRRDDLQQK